MKRALLAFLGLALLVTPALATTLSSGTSIAGPAPLGSSPFSTLTFVTSVGGAWSYPSPPDPTPGSGTYVESVYKDGGGHLVFAFQVHDNGPDIVETLTSAAWKGGVTVDAEQWKGGGLWLTGSPAGQTTSVSLHSGVIRWSMSPALTGGANSYVLLLYTDATRYAPGSFTIQDGGTATVAGLVPATPEPATFALLGVGLAGLGTFLRLRK